MVHGQHLGWCFTHLARGQGPERAASSPCPGRSAGASAPGGPPSLPSDALLKPGLSPRGLKGTVPCVEQEEDRQWPSLTSGVASLTTQDFEKSRKGEKSRGPQNSIHILYGTFIYGIYVYEGFPGGSEGKVSACSVADLGSTPGLG